MPFHEAMALRGSRIEKNLRKISATLALEAQKALMKPLPTSD